MSIDGLVAAYRIDTGEKVRIPPHWLDHPTLGKPFRLTPPKPAGTRRGAPKNPDASDTTEAPDLDTPDADPGAETTDTPATGDPKEL